MAETSLFQPIKTGRTFQLIAAQIKEKIFSGEIQPGEKLPTERELAKTFNVSRVTLRSALLQLEQAGLLDIHSGSGGGFFIRELDATNLGESFSDMLRAGKSSIAEITEARLVIEPQIAFMAAQRATADDIARLEETIEELGRNRPLGNPGPEDFDFHIVLAEASHNGVLATICRCLIHILFFSIKDIPATKEGNTAIARQHSAVIQAVRDGDGQGAQRLMYEHVHAMKRLMDS